MERTAEPAALIHSLAETTARLEAVAQHLSADQLTISPGRGGWSPNEILWHVRAVADVYGEHISRILNEDLPHWRHVSPRARMKTSRYDQLPFADSLAAFVGQRSALVRLLESLAPETWQRMALVRVGNREWRLTLQERVWGMANHEEVHCAQMERVAAAMSRPG